MIDVFPDSAIIKDLILLQSIRNFIVQTQIYFPESQAGGKCSPEASADAENIKTKRINLYKNITFCPKLIVLPTNGLTCFHQDNSVFPVNSFNLFYLTFKTFLKEINFPSVETP